MKNRILAIFLILIICVSMIPMTVSAASNQELEIVKQEAQADGYTIHYFTPAGYSDVFVLKFSETNYSLYFVESGGMYLCNTSGYGKITKNSACIKKINSIDEVYAILFEGKYSNHKFQTNAANESPYYGDFIINGTDNAMYVSPSLDSLGSVNTQSHKDNSIREDYMTFAEFYGEWYYEQNGMYPQPDLEGSEHMKGEHYIIAKQKILTPDDWYDLTMQSANKNDIYNYGEGYVETCDDIKLESKDGTYIYTVISTERASGDFISFDKGSFFENVISSLKDIILLFPGNSRMQIANRVMNKEGEAGEYRNKYPFLSTKTASAFFYNEEETLNRYYFSNLEDACKFVLYGTVGAKYQHKEEGKTHYVYGINDIIYNNYDLDGFPKAEIPQFTYPLGQAQFILREHEENVYEREYVLITMDYFPFASVITAEYKFNIPNSVVNAKYRNVFQIDGDESFNFKDLTQYEETDKYNAQGIQHFQLYRPDLEEQYKYSSWDLIYWTVPLKEFKYEYDENGNLIVQGGSIFENEFAFEIKKDENGNDIWVDNLNDKRFDKDGNEYYDEDKDGIYTDKDGNTIDDSKLTDPKEDWYNSLTEYTSTLKNISLLLEEFLKIIEYAEDETKPLVDLLNAFMKNLPTVFRTIIGFVILAMILRRIFKSN